MPVQRPGPTAFLPIWPQLVAMTALFLSSCGLTPGTGGLGSCAAGTAEMQVYDTGLRRVCGCAEAGNVAFGPNQPMTCTVNVGTRLFVNFVGITRNAQIAVSATSWVTQVRSPSTSAVQSDVIELNSTGTFNFVNVYNSTLTGTLVVN
jgi:hypothetical protein